MNNLLCLLCSAYFNTHKLLTALFLAHLSVFGVAFFLTAADVYHLFNSCLHSDTTTLEYLGLERRTIFKWILRRQDGRAWTEFSHQNDIMLGSFEQGVEYII